MSQETAGPSLLAGPAPSPVPTLSPPDSPPEVAGVHVTAPLSPEERRRFLEQNEGVIRRAAWRACRRYRSWLTASDLAQDGWLLADAILARWCPLLGRNRTIQAWLYLMLVNALYDRARAAARTRCKRAVVYEADLQDRVYKEYKKQDESDRTHHCRQRVQACRLAQRLCEDRLDLADAQAKLSQRQALLLRLHYEEGLTFDEVVARTGLKRSLVRDEMVAARQIVRRHVVS